MIVIISSLSFISILYREMRRLEKDSVVAANEPEEVRKARERKSAKTIAIFLGLLVLCFIPMIIIPIINILLSVSRSGNSYNVLEQNIFLFTSTIASSNSSLNVAVYF